MEEVQCYGILKPQGKVDSTFLCNAVSAAGWSKGPGGVFRLTNSMVMVVDSL